MLRDRSLAALVAKVAFASLALCSTQAVLAYPEDTFDPGAPPSEFPDHSGEMNNFGSTFIFSFSEPFKSGDEVIFTPRAKIDCTTCAFPVAQDSVHTFHVTGRVLGQIRDNNGNIVANSAGVYDMYITITGVRATVSETVADGILEQTITYRANLTTAGAVSGELLLDVLATPRPQPLPPVDAEGQVAPIKVEARFVATGTGTTPFLAVGPNPPATFPAIPASSPRGLGQGVPENVVFQVTQKWRGPVAPPPPVITVAPTPVTN